MSKQEESDARYRAAVAKLERLAQAARFEAGGEDRVSISISGRGDDGRFTSIFGQAGSRWRVEHLVCFEAISGWIHPESILDEDVTELGHALGRVETAVEAFGNGSYRLYRRTLRRRRS